MPSGVTADGAMAPSAYDALRPWFSAPACTNCMQAFAPPAVGERFPLHCTANGKAILACFSPEDVEELIDKSVAEHPQHPLRDRRALLKEIDEVRQTKLAYDLGEHGEGISAVGTALLDAFGRPVAISVPVPQQRFEDVREEVSKKLRDFREKIKAVIRK